MRRLALLLVLLAGVAHAQFLDDGFGEHGGFEGFANGTGVGRCVEVDVTTGLGLTATGRRCTLTATGGPGGSGTAAPLPFPSQDPIDGSIGVYIGLGSGVANTEAFVQTRMSTAAQLGNLTCTASTATVGQTISVFGRVGACGTLADASGVTCVVGAGQSGCTGVGTITVSAGQCVALRVQPSATFAAPLWFNCLMERVG